MFVKTKGIVLHKTKFSETSLIVKIFTEQFGTQSFIIKNAFSKKAKINHHFFTSLAILELTFDDFALHKLAFLKDVSFVRVYNTIPFDPSRNAILFFYNELLYKLLFASFEDPKLYQFIEKALYELDDPSSYQSDIHLHFLIDLLHCLGISPENDWAEHNPYFSLEENRFVGTINTNELYLSPPASHYLSNLLDRKMDVIPSKQIRNEVLTGMVKYLVLNNEHIHSIESLNVLIDLMK